MLAHSTQQAVAVAAQNIVAHLHRLLVAHTAAAAAHKDEACTARAQARRLSGLIRRDGHTGRRRWVSVAEEGIARTGRACWIRGWGRIELGRAGRRMVGVGGAGEVVSRQARLRRRRGSEEASG